MFMSEKNAQDKGVSSIADDNDDCTAATTATLPPVPLRRCHEYWLLWLLLYEVTVTRPGLAESACRLQQPNTPLLSGALGIGRSQVSEM